MMVYPRQTDAAARGLLRTEEDLLCQVVDGPERVVNLFRGLEDEKATKVVSVKMDEYGQILDCEIVGMGEQAQTLMNPRVIVRGALGALVRSIILVLNHPKGSSKPTKAELQTYQKVVGLGRDLGFDVLDMVIVSKHDWFSVREGAVPIESEGD